MTIGSLCRKNHAGIAQGAIAYDNRLVSEAIIHYFVVVEDSYRVGFGDAVSEDTEDSVLVPQEVSIVDSYKFWIVDGWYTVRWHTAASYLVGRYGSIAQIEAVFRLAVDGRTESEQTRQQGKYSD